ncbi:cell division protein ftsz [Mycoplasmopsis columbina SF7]|uniref:Cell division protein FtsZ n=1 Tax=Mycoplasmopsis columbina SF7 TaxID=1037410 RepID=F9UK47_9BACT|nr:cell division protein FtsZ [Mycoplasmopsis columbina]EGV00052.1 cell division protein ftsz [Mycoplasmopsis columbina SF7]
MEHDYKNVKVKVIGIGGAGNNAINLLLEEDLPNVELWIANTDYQDLEKSKCTNKLYLKGDSEGYGAGGDPKIGKKAAEDSIREIDDVLQDTDLLIITAGLGGGTGTGAAPVIAKAAKDKGIVTLAIVSTPFTIFEGSRRKKIALEGLEELKNSTDSYIVLSNDKLMQSNLEGNSEDAFKFANITLKNSIKAIWEVIFEKFTINIDFNDLRKVLKNGSQTFISIGKGFGNDAWKKAVEQALLNQLNEFELSDPKKIIIIFKMKQSSFKEIEEAKKLIDQYLNVKDDDVEILLGIKYLENVDERDKSFSLTVIASGLNSSSEKSPVYSSSYQRNFDEPFNPYDLNKVDTQQLTNSFEINSTEENSEENKFLITDNYKMADEEDEKDSTKGEVKKKRFPSFWKK